jgi:SAM-dependent methyltransferase
MRVTRTGSVQPQGEKSDYFTPTYNSPGRFAGYACQINEILALHPRRILEVGIGNGMVSSFLRQSGLSVTTLDYDEHLEPDIVGSVTAIPVANASYDVVACFQVLEHLPFDLFVPVLKEIHRVTNSHAILSLPDVRPYVHCSFHLPLLGDHSLFLELPRRFSRRTNNPQHYWEVNARGYTVPKILDMMRQADFTPVKTFRLKPFRHHRMFVLQKK